MNINGSRRDTQDVNSEHLGKMAMWKGADTAKVTRVNDPHIVSNNLSWLEYKSGG